MRRNEDGTLTVVFEVTNLRMIMSPEGEAPPAAPAESTTILTVYYSGKRVGWVEEAKDGFRRWCYANEDRHQAARKRNENLPWRGWEALDEAGPLLDAHHPRLGTGVVKTADVRTALGNGTAKLNLREYRPTPGRRWI